MSTKIPPLQLARRISLGITLVGLTILTILHQRMQGIPSIDALDPFGGLETLLKFLAGGEYIKKIEPGTIVLFAAVIAMGVLLSRFFCGWFCAFGALQGVFGWLGKKIFRRRFVMPVRLDSILRWVKYPVLVAVIYFTWKTGELVIRPYDPLAAYGHLSAGLSAVWAEFAVGFVLLVAVILLSMLYERAFCKYLCPLGAMNAILGRIPLFRIKRVESTCISCSACDRVCPMNIDISGAGTVNSPECIACMECVTVCPTKKNSLLTNWGGKVRKTGTIVFIGFAIFVGAAVVGQVMGMLRFSAPSLSERAASGLLAVEDIKGSSSYEMVAESFGIDLERLYREAGVDPLKVPPTTMLKDTRTLMGLDEFEADEVRIAVASILGIEYVPESASTMIVQTGNVEVPVSENPVFMNPQTNGEIPSVSENMTTNKATNASTDKQGQFTVPVDFVLEGTRSEERRVGEEC